MLLCYAKNYAIATRNIRNLKRIFRSSISTLEEILWTSDSNPGSDFVVIKEDDQETVI